ncbi:MAG: hypothetical protein HZC23_14225 [Rhodocyclales bacterium]|nr:hypothetical protein [Rhodocyclales bacterium]
MTVTIAFDLTLLTLVGLNLLGILAYVGTIKLRAHRLARARQRIVETVAAYFSRTGLAVKAEVVSLPDSEHFIVIADTEPLKRLRHSHIVELVLIEEVKKATDFVVERVFWRFPLPAREGAALGAPEQAATVPPSAEAGDAYLAEGLARLRTPEGLEVGEDSWAHFQEAVQLHDDAREAAQPPS